MNEIKSIQIQLEKLNLTLSHRVRDIYSSLEELRDVSNILLNVTPNSVSEINYWIDKEAYCENDDGYYLSDTRNKQFESGALPQDAVTYHWPATQKNNVELRYRFFSLRNIGGILKRLKEKLDGVTIIYFQDIEFNACVAYPYFDMTTTIPADFNWGEYIPFYSVSQDNNPERQIMWSDPEGSPRIYQPCPCSAI